MGSRSGKARTLLSDGMAIRLARNPRNAVLLNQLLGFFDGRDHHFNDRTPFHLEHTHKIVG